MRISPRRVAREFALQGIYQWLYTGESPTVVLRNLKELEGYEGADEKFLKGAVEGSIRSSDGTRPQLEPLIDRKWDEVSPIERAVLLLGAWELNHCPETPYRVTINEAIELAKKFGGTDGHKYVNGILDKLAAQLRPDEVAARKSRDA